MKEIKIRLKEHTSWCDYSDTPISNDIAIEQLELLMRKGHHFICGDICTIDISNYAEISLNFYEDRSETEVRELTSIMLYFISLCNGYNCEYYEWAIIDGVARPKFFNFAKEDELTLNLYKNIKFYELGLEDIANQFGDILYKLFTANRRYILMLLSNYYSTVVYKDFIGNGEYLFRNIVTNVEAIMTAINKETYNKITQDNKEYLNFIANELKISHNKIGKHLIAKSRSLEEKLKDAIDLIEKKFNLKFKLRKNIECNKIANTRNLVSHASDLNMECLSDEERSMYTSVLTETFRMLFFIYCEIDSNLIGVRFLNNKPIRNVLEQVFNIVNN